jgi:hypothetical protein
MTPQYYLLGVTELRSRITIALRKCFLSMTVSSHISMPTALEQIKFKNKLCAVRNTFSLVLMNISYVKSEWKYLFVELYT